MVKNEIKDGFKKCPICDNFTLDIEDDSFDICPICMWEDDGIQVDNPNYYGGANKMSLNEYRKNWKEGNPVE